MKTINSSYRGYCARCETFHQIPQGNSYQYGLNLLQRIEEEGYIDFVTCPECRDPDLKTEYLFGEARGKMFGVLECMTSEGTLTFLHGFSGQYNGRWLVNGWVDPLFDVDVWHTTSVEVEKEIKRLTGQINTGCADTIQITKIKETRKKLSQKLMKDIHSLYRLTNFRGETKEFSQLFPNNLPTGIGDCCAPKLLCHAAKNNLLPVSMAEFFVGKENRSGSKIHGQFYQACEEKCQPLLGFLLCGLDSV